MKTGRAARLFPRRTPPGAERRRSQVAQAKSRFICYTVTQTGEDTTVVFRDIKAPLIKEALATARETFDAWERAEAELQDLLVSTPPSAWSSLRGIFERMREALEGTR